MPPWAPAELLVVVQAVAGSSPSLTLGRKGRVRRPFAVKPTDAIAAATVGALLHRPLARLDPLAQPVCLGGLLPPKAVNELRRDLGRPPRLVQQPPEMARPTPTTVHAW